MTPIHSEKFITYIRRIYQAFSGGPYVCIKQIHKMPFSTYIGRDCGKHLPIIANISFNVGKRQNIHKEVSMQTDVKTL